MNKKKLKILLVLRSLAYYHHYRSAFLLLAEHGHEVLVIFDEAWSKSKNASVVPLENIKKQFPNFDYDWAPMDRNFLGWLLYYIREVRNYRDFILYNNQSLHYQERQRRYLNFLLRGALKVAPRATNAFLRQNFMGHIFKFFENHARASKPIKNYINSYNPDLVVVAPLNMRYSSADLEYAKAAKELGIATILPVISWDNLTTKGLIHFAPDLVLVWNEGQKRVAESRHHIPEKRIRIIGAMPFDLWFPNRKPSVNRQQFCALHGLTANNPIVTYLGSSANIARDETAVIKNLSDFLKNMPDDRLKLTQIIVRPHPAHFKHYAKFLDCKDIIVLPKDGALPDSESSAKLFYDTLFHSSAVLGINTSGMIDALLADKPVIALITDEFKSTQSDTLHFKELERSGAMHVANDFQTATTVLGNILNGRDELSEKRKTFALNFARPLGLNISAAEAFLKEIENFKKRDD